MCKPAAVLFVTCLATPSAKAGSLPQDSRTPRKRVALPLKSERTGLKIRLWPTTMANVIGRWLMVGIFLNLSACATRTAIDESDPALNARSLSVDVDDYRIAATLVVRTNSCTGDGTVGNWKSGDQLVNSKFSIDGSGTFRVIGDVSLSGRFADRSHMTLVAKPHEPVAVNFDKEGDMSLDQEDIDNVTRLREGLASACSDIRAGRLVELKR